MAQEPLLGLWKGAQKEAGMTDTLKIQGMAMEAVQGDPSYLSCSSPFPATEPSMAPYWH